jgi:hypothetical protein
MKRSITGAAKSENEIQYFGWSRDAVTDAFSGLIVANANSFKSKVNETEKIVKFMMLLAENRDTNIDDIPSAMRVRMKEVWCKQIWPEEWEAREFKNAAQTIRQSANAFLEEVNKAH